MKHLHTTLFPSGTSLCRFHPVFRQNEREQRVLNGSVHKNVTNFLLTNRAGQFTLYSISGGFIPPKGPRYCGKEVGTDAAALCHPGSTLTLQTIGAYCARFRGLTGRALCVHTVLSSHRLQRRRWYFYTHFSVVKGDGRYDNGEAGSKQRMVQGPGGPGY